MLSEDDLFTGLLVLAVVDQPNFVSKPIFVNQQPEVIVGVDSFQSVVVSFHPDSACFQPQVASFHPQIASFLHGII